MSVCAAVESSFVANRLSAICAGARSLQAHDVAFHVAAPAGTRPVLAAGFRKDFGFVHLRTPRLAGKMYIVSPDHFLYPPAFRTTLQTQIDSAGWALV